MEKQSLLEKYPKIFRQYSLPMTETCMCWGLECGNGWYDLLDQLCSQLQWNTDRNRYPQVEATQVKEKFGTLRFYYDTIFVADCGNEKEEHQYGVIEGMVHFAEVISAFVCEGCGTTKGVFQTEGWIRTTCKECEDKRDSKQP